jgi:hypothetical protein
VALNASRDGVFRRHRWFARLGSEAGFRALLYQPARVACHRPALGMPTGTIPYADADLVRRRAREVRVTGE